MAVGGGTIEREGDVRAWLARIAAREGVGVVWYEPPRNGHGATTGHPDASLSFPDGIRVEVELKAWARLQCGDFAARIRREQIRYHFRANQKGTRTLLAWGVLGEARLCAVHGSRAPKTVIVRMPPDDCSGYGLNEGSEFLNDVKLNNIK